MIGSALCVELFTTFKNKHFVEKKFVIISDGGIKLELFSIIFDQVALMMILMMAGGVAYQCKWINETGVRQISNLLLYIVNPMTMIAAYQTTFTYEKLRDLSVTFVISALVLTLGIVVAKFLFGKLEGVEKFGICFSNCGFMGIPLIKAVLGDGAVFYLSAYLVAANLITWTYGIYLVTQDKSYLSIKKAILNPGTLSVVAGLLLFFSPVKLPELLYNGVNTLGNLNTPLAMIVLGSYIARIPIKKLLFSCHLYYVTALRLIVYPLGTLLLLCLIPNSLYTIKITIYIASVAPAAVNTMLFAIQFGGNSEKGASFVSMSSILSLITMPIIISMSQFVW